MEDIKDAINIYNDIVEDIVVNMEKKEYAYQDNQSYYQEWFKGLRENDLRKSTQQYWKELFLRIHFAANITLLRSQKWVEGMNLGLKRNNILLFSASLRALLEATTDSYYSLQGVPLPLACNFKNIVKALES